MSKVKVGINGFGRIGRQAFKALLERHADSVEVVAINDPSGVEAGAHLLKYDSTYGRFAGDVRAADDALVVNGNSVRFTKEFEIAKIGWREMGVAIVVESTGVFTDANKARAHIDSGAQKVIISAPAKNEDLTVVIGVNDDKYDPGRHNILSNASCTTNCVAPMVKVLNDAFGMEYGLMSTIHAYTNDQRIQDTVHSDLRRARAAAQSIIPTTTGAARAVTLVIPELKGRIDGMAFRVPTITGSVTDLVAQLRTPASAADINKALKDASEGSLKGVLAYSDEPLVSMDYVGQPYSCTIDALSTAALDGGMVKIVGWYDNEWGYACRTAQLVEIVAKSL